jgi:hypothetical protein
MSSYLTRAKSVDVKAKKSIINKRYYARKSFFQGSKRIPPKISSKQSYASKTEKRVTAILKEKVVKMKPNHANIVSNHI